MRTPAPLALSTHGWSGLARVKPTLPAVGCGLPANPLARGLSRRRWQRVSGKDVHLDHNAHGVVTVS
ncbi:hypothetical protein, partial [Rhodoferax sp.]|uniref:hypothetical protein n=1 Tax=Rhodoferax sp. TaxID=50421 RepID=UPI00276DC9CD|nr:hypothetical protein [Rhodoferax sp.]